MMTIGSIARVFIACHKVDFRKRHDGLLAEAYRLGLEVLAGDLLVFIGRDKRRIQLLYADSNGLWVSYKRFHRGTLQSQVRFVAEPSCREINQAELTLLVEGAAYSVHRVVKPWP